MDIMKHKAKSLFAFVFLLIGVSVVAGQLPVDTTTQLNMFLRDLRAGAWGTTVSAGSIALGTGGAGDTFLVRDAANRLAMRNSTTAQGFYIYETYTDANNYARGELNTNAGLRIYAHTVSGGSNANSGDVILGTNNAGKFIIKGGTSASQIATTQGSVPTCTSNCGTSPSVVGSDTNMKVTMGATGVPASGFVVTFNGTWAAAPSCTAASALSTMVVGKMPIAVQVSTTTVTVTTNGTAPGNSDVYAINCFGVQ